MPVPSFSSIKGDTQEQLVDSLEKLRKELWWLLQSLDTSNVKELNAEVINAGRIEAKYLKVGHETEFEDGYDTRSLFEVTNDRITMEVESIHGDLARLEITADQIRSEVIDIENNLSSSITQTAAQIRSEVSAQVTSINGQMVTIRNDVSSVTQTASQIQSTVTSQQTQINNQGTRISSAESSITQQANQISSKVSQTDFTGRTITSLINQDPYAVSINAEKINLNGAVMVNGSISGSTDINVNRDIYVGNNIYMAPYGSGSKSLIFDGVSRIVGDWSSIRVSAPNLNLDGSVTIGNSGGSVDFNGRVNFAYASSISGVARANSSGIGISTDGTYLYVQVNGVTRNKVKLEAA